MRLVAIAILIANLSACLADSGGDASQPPQKTTPPSDVAPHVGEQTSSGDEKVDALLDRLEEKGLAIKGLKCRLVYTHVMVDPVESRKVKEGSLLFARAEPNSRFLIHFGKMIADEVVVRSDEYFAFDGRWLVERNDKARTVIKREIAEQGRNRDPFKIGEGPFPLPFGQKRSEILKSFKVTLEPFTLGDPLQSQHLRCVPRPGTELAARYSRVDIYVDRRLELPVRIVTENARDDSRIEVDFKDIDTGDAPAGSRFLIEEPAGFDVRVEPASTSGGVLENRRSDQE